MHHDEHQFILTSGDDYGFFSIGGKRGYFQISADADSVGVGVRTSSALIALDAGNEGPLIVMHGRGAGSITLGADSETAVVITESAKSSCVMSADEDGPYLFLQEDGDSRAGLKIADHAGELWLLDQQGKRVKP